MRVEEDGRRHRDTSARDEPPGPGPRRARPSGDPARAVAYLRASTTDQRNSPEAQREAIASWARAAKVEIVAWHCDHASGRRDIAGRPGLASAVADLGARHAGRLVVARRDRLARSALVALGIERVASAYGARVVAADGVGNGDTAADELIRRILDAAAEYERALICLRTKAALAAMRARGERTGTLPYGSTVGPDGRTLVAAPAEQEVIAYVRARRVAGRSIRAIVADCAQRGLASRSGRPFGRSQIERIVRRCEAGEAPPGVRTSAEGAKEG